MADESDEFYPAESTAFSKRVYEELKEQRCPLSHSAHSQTIM